MVPMQGELLPFERLTREEAIERTMTPLPARKQNRQVRLIRASVHTLGAYGDTIVYGPATPFLNRQLRESYAPDHYTRLGREMHEFGQLQDCGSLYSPSRGA